MNPINDLLRRLACHNLNVKSFGKKVSSEFGAKLSLFFWKSDLLLGQNKIGLLNCRLLYRQSINFNNNNCNSPTVFTSTTTTTITTANKIKSTTGTTLTLTTTTTTATIKSTTGKASILTTTTTLLQQ